eukprot:809402-Prymnesium_polylepis.1
MPNGGLRWVGGWAATGAPHALFASVGAEPLELLSIDESHVLRNPATAWVASHHALARHARRRG